MHVSFVKNPLMHVSLMKNPQPMEDFEEKRS